MKSMKIYENAMKADENQYFEIDASHWNRCATLLFEAPPARWLRTFAASLLDPRLVRQFPDLIHVSPAPQILYVKRQALADHGIHCVAQDVFAWKVFVHFIIFSLISIGFQTFQTFQTVPQNSEAARTPPEQACYSFTRLPLCHYISLIYLSISH